MAGKERGFWETIIRIIHVAAGMFSLGIAGWFVLAVSPFNPYGFWIFLIFGIALLLIGILGRKKDVLITFFSSGV